MAADPVGTTASPPSVSTSWRKPWISKMTAPSPGHRGNPAHQDTRPSRLQSGAGQPTAPTAMGQPQDGVSPQAVPAAAGSRPDHPRGSLCRVGVHPLPLRLPQAGERRRHLARRQTPAVGGARRSRTPPARLPVPGKETGPRRKACW
jgi:hypothetical protein